MQHPGPHSSPLDSNTCSALWVGHREIFPGTGFTLPGIRSGFPVKGTNVKRTALLIPVLLAALAACGGDPAPSSTPDATLSADLNEVEQHWDALTALQQEQVCQAALGTPASGAVDSGSGQIPSGGPDYRAMLDALMEAGLNQPDAAAMLPTVADECA